MNGFACSDSSLDRVLVVDDDHAIHEDYRRCLGPASDEGGRLDVLRTAVFGGPAPAEPPAQKVFELVHAYQGREALDRVVADRARGLRFSVAFVDMRMPPGWNGVETVRELRRADPDISFVVCTAYSDFTWDAVMRGVGEGCALHLLRKPFTAPQVRRFAEVLNQKWRLARRGTGRRPLPMTGSD